MLNFWIRSFKHYFASPRPAPQIFIFAPPSPSLVIYKEKLLYLCCVNYVLTCICGITNLKSNVFLYYKSRIQHLTKNLKPNIKNLIKNIHILKYLMIQIFVCIVCISIILLYKYIRIFLVFVSKFYISHTLWFTGITKIGDILLIERVTKIGGKSFTQKNRKSQWIKNIYKKITFYSLKISAILVKNHSPKNWKF